MKLIPTYERRLAALALLFLGLLAPAFVLAADEGAWTFAIIGDHRCVATAATVTLDGTGYVGGGINEPVLRDIAQALKAEGVEFAIDVGDLVAKYDSKLLWGLPSGAAAADAFMATQLSRFTAVWNEYSGNLPIFPVRGNHENTVSTAPWLANQAILPGISSLLPTICSPPGEAGLTYAFTYRNCLFIALDAYPVNSAKYPALSGRSPTLSMGTMTWLEQLLNAPDRLPHVFVYGHTPAYEVWDTEKPWYTTARDGLASPRPMPAGRLVDCTAASLVRNPFWNLLANAGANYFCGHDHTYLRGSAAGVTQCIIGNGGAPAYPAYPEDPYVESADAVPNTPAWVDNCDSPRITKEFFDQSGDFGYVIVKIHDSHANIFNATATYKAEPAPGAGFVTMDKWNWKIVMAKQPPRSNANHP